MNDRLSLLAGVFLVLALLVGCAAPATVAPTQPVAPVAATKAPTVSAINGTSASTPATTAAATAVAAATAIPAPKIKRGGIIRYSQTSDWGTADLHVDVTPRTDQQIHTESLVEIRQNPTNKRFEVTPLLAESYTQPDPKTILFKLRQGVKFHDGSEWNADVAKWNLLRMKDHPKSGSKDNVRSLDTVDVVDKYTIKFNMKGPSAAALPLLTTSANGRPMMMSKEAYDKNGEEAMARKLIGTGPFELPEWSTGDKQVYKKFAGYWQKGVDGQPKPYLDGLEVHWRADPTVALLEMKAGTQHFLTGVLAKDITTVQSSPDMELFQPAEWAANLKMLGLNQKEGPFKDNLKLRLAAQYAIDREAIAKTMGGPTGFPATSIIAEGQVGWSKDIPAYQFDLNKAKQMMTEAGFPNGFDFNMQVISRQPDLPQAEVVKSMLDKAGFRTKIDPIERIAWLAKMAANNYEATTYSVNLEVDPYLTLAFRYSCEGKANFASWCNPKFDQCLEDSQLAKNDDERGQKIRQCLQMPYDDAHYVHQWVQKLYDAYSKKLKGWGPYVTAMNFWPDLYLD
jgi:peptide/nickel transport system substrate-binding protein